MMNPKNPGKTLYYGITDTWAITKRYLYHIIRLPELLFFSSVQPIMFLLLFNYVFGGALGGTTGAPGGKYIAFLLPGILVQAVMFGCVQTGIGLAQDMGKGIIDRFRSLPMSRISVIAGRTFADLLRNLWVILIMLGVGYLLGFRFLHGIGGALGLVGIVLLFAYALSWGFALLGVTVGDPETAQVAAFAFIFPITFASANFVPVQTMPHWLQAFVRNQPVTFVANAARQFALGTGGDGGAIWKAAAWAIGLLIIFVPLAILQYKRQA